MEVATRIAGYRGGRVSRRVNTKQISICPHCNCMTFTLMDKDGNRFCGKCKEDKPKEVK